MTTHAPAAGLDAGAANGPRLLLAEHHREIENACMALLGRTYADEPRALVAQYRTFERAITEHLEAEEHLILPAYALDAPDDAQALRSDHDTIRLALTRVGIEVELHLVRAHTVEALVDALRAHAAREDAGMYPWAQVHLPGEARQKLVNQIGASLRDLLLRPRPPSAP
jgi:hemerythrin-like domain-containing protein